MSKSNCSILEKLEENRDRTKKDIRKKLFESSKSGELIALYKLISNENDRKKLSKSHQDITTRGKKKTYLKSLCFTMMRTLV